MGEVEPFDPLEQQRFGTRVDDALINALISRLVEPLPPGERFMGAGIYALYYVGQFPPYKSIAESNLDANNRFSLPIYVGKAVPPGARTGVYTGSLPAGSFLHGRLREHARSITQARNLNLEDFYCRYLVVQDDWITLGERFLIRKFLPIWNTIIDGFGIHDPGKGRYQQRRSTWDVLHPGRTMADRLQPSNKSEVEILLRLKQFLEERDSQ